MKEYTPADIERIILEVMQEYHEVTPNRLACEVADRTGRKAHLPQGYYRVLEHLLTEYVLSEGVLFASGEEIIRLKKDREKTYANLQTA